MKEIIFFQVMFPDQLLYGITGKLHVHVILAFCSDPSMNTSQHDLAVFKNRVHRELLNSKKFWVKNNAVLGKIWTNQATGLF